MADEDFGKLFEASINGVKTDLRTGEKITGTVAAINKSDIIVDLGLRNDGLMDILDVTDKEGHVTVKVGDTITAFNMGMVDGYFKLQKRAGGNGEVLVDSALQDAYDAKIPVEGKVTEERKGGFGIDLSGTPAFCPFSQIDARRTRKEPAEYIGQTFQFLISEFSENGKNIVVSRRKLVEEEQAKMREYLKDILQEGDIREGIVVRVVDFGAFVDLGGIEGLIPVSEISWSRGIKAEEALSVGQRVSVKIIRLDWADGDASKERVTLSLKQAVQSPWEKIANGEATPYTVGSKHRGRVVRIAEFGAFVELEPGLDGLAHISQLGQESKVEKVEDVCKVGDEVDVTILDIDGENHRIRLCFGDPKTPEEKPAELNVEQEQQVSELSLGSVIEGEVESLKPFGVFVKLPDGQTGLLHISQCGITDNGPMRSRELFKKFPLHSKVEVIIREVNGKRISLTLPEIIQQENERNTILDYKDEASKGFGSMDDAFANLKL